MDNLYCDGGIDCKCVCHQKDYPLPKDFPHPQDNQLEDTVSSWLNQKAERLSVLTDLRILIRTLLSTQAKASQERERKSIGEAIERLIRNAGDESEVACNDLLSYADLLKQPLHSQDPTN